MSEPPGDTATSSMQSLIRNHQRHAERLEWIDSNFDPNNTDLEALTQAAHGLAKKWNRRSSSRKRA
jgi:hypothetical protein